jgi:predicted acylesterase/phospholipase RssA
MGVVRALWMEGLLPRVISGASAGSIMTAIIG